MKPQELFVESLADAVSNAIVQIGGHKKVGLMLWPEKSARDAGNQLLNCLNPDHQQKLSLEQIELVIRAARNTDNHDVMKYLCDQYGYEFKAISKEQIKATIANRIESARDEILSAMREWEKVK